MGAELTEHDRFYALYEPLRKKYQLSAHIRATIYDSEEDFIEIFQGAGREKKLLYRSKGELKDCYRQMVLNLTIMVRRQEKSR